MKTNKTKSIKKSASKFAKQVGKATKNIPLNISSGIHNATVDIKRMKPRNECLKNISDSLVYIDNHIKNEKVEKLVAPIKDALNDLVESVKTEQPIDVITFCDEISKKIKDLGYIESEETNVLQKKADDTNISRVVVKSEETIAAVKERMKKQANSEKKD